MFYYILLIKALFFAFMLMHEVKTTHVPGVKLAQDYSSAVEWS